MSSVARDVVAAERLPLLRDLAGSVLPGREPTLVHQGAPILSVATRPKSPFENSV